MSHMPSSRVGPPHRLGLELSDAVGPLMCMLMSVSLHGLKSEEVN